MYPFKILCIRLWDILTIGPHHFSQMQILLIHIPAVFIHKSESIFMHIKNLEWYVRYWKEHPTEVKHEAMNPATGNMSTYLEDSAMVVSYLVTPAELDALPAQFVYDGDAGFWYGDIEGGRLMAAVNYSYDPIEECVFEFAELPEKLFHLQPDGSWKSVPFTVSGSRITVPVRLECAEIAIFRDER